MMAEENLEENVEEFVEDRFRGSGEEFSVVVMLRFGRDQKLSSLDCRVSGRLGEVGTGEQGRKSVRKRPELKVARPGDINKGGRRREPARSRVE